MIQKLIRFYRSIKHRYLVKIPNDYQGLILLLILVAILLK
jgi:hypothetical protein